MFFPSSPHDFSSPTAVMSQRFVSNHSSMTKDRPIGQRAAKRQESLDGAIERLSSASDKRQKIISDALVESNMDMKRLISQMERSSDKAINDKFMLGLASLNTTNESQSDVKHYIELRKIECLRAVKRVQNIDKEGEEEEHEVPMIRTIHQGKEDTEENEKEKENEEEEEYQDLEDSDE